MKLAEVGMIGILGLLLWSEWQDWQLNRSDTIDFTRQDVSAINRRQCDQLRQKMVELTGHSAEVQLQFSGQDLTEVNHHLKQAWRQQGCEQWFTSQGY